MLTQAKIIIKSENNMKTTSNDLNALSIKRIKSQFHRYE